MRRRAVHRPLRFVGFAADVIAEGFSDVAFAWRDPNHVEEGILTIQFGDRPSAQRALAVLCSRGEVAVCEDGAVDLVALYEQPWPETLRVRLADGAFLDAHAGPVRVWDLQQLLGPAGLCPGGGLGERARAALELVESVQEWARAHGSDVAARPGTLAVRTWLDTATRAEHGWMIPRATQADQEWGQAAIYPGRAEVYREGCHTVRVYDVNSMYPSVMADMVFPDPRSGREGGAAEYRDPELSGIVRARVRVPDDVPLPPLPWRARSGEIYYPTGEWEATYVTSELRVAEQAGVEVTPLAGYYYRRSLPSPFAGWVKRLYAEKAAARESGDSRQYEIVKRVLNCLWGRLALREGVPVREIVRVGEWAPKRCERCRGCLAGGACARLAGLSREGEFWLRQTYSGRLPDYANATWAAFILAEARIRLADLMRWADVPSVVRVHTDSITVACGDSWPRPYGDLRALLGPGLGQLKIEYDGLEDTRSPNEFRRDGARVAGVPASAAEEYWQTGRATVRRRRGLLDGLALGRVGAWENVTLRRQGSRLTRADGGARPWRIEELQ